MNGKVRFYNCIAILIILAVLVAGCKPVPTPTPVVIEKQVTRIVYRDRVFIVTPEPSSTPSSISMPEPTKVRPSATATATKVPCTFSDCRGDGKRYVSGDCSEPWFRGDNWYVDIDGCPQPQSALTATPTRRPGGPDEPTPGPTLRPTYTPTRRPSATPNPTPRP